MCVAFKPQDHWRVNDTSYFICGLIIAFMNLWNVTLAVRGHHAARVGPFLRCVRFLFCYLFFHFGPNANYSPAAVVHTDCALLWLSLRTKRAGCVHLKVRAQTSKSFARFPPPPPPPFPGHFSNLGTRCEFVSVWPNAFLGSTSTIFFFIEKS